MITSYIISLKNPLDLINQLKTFDFNTILIDGVKTNTLSSKRKKKFTGNYFRSTTIPDSVLGCAMAHIKTWKTFLSTNKPYCMIFEDDAIFEDNFKKKFDLCLRHLPNDFDIFYTGCFYNNNFTSKNMNEYIKIPDFFFATHSYMISRNGAIKLLKYIDNNIYTHIDMMIYMLFLQKKINVYSTIERLVYQTSSDNRQISFNNSNNFPLIIDYLLSCIEIDKKVTLNFLFFIPIYQINGYIINASTFLFLILGIIFCKYKIPFNILFISYLILSLPDILSLKNINEFFINGILFLLPSYYLILF
jgi:GR25 family glycosyltransferase involved in LPS biosynthesis